VSDRPGRIALLDWDHTLHPGFTLGPWLRALARDAHEAAIAERFRDAQDRYLDGSLAYESFVDVARDAYTTLADGRTVDELGSLAADLAPRLSLRPGAAELVAALLARGIRPIVISGAPMEVLQAHAAILGLDPADVTGWTLVRDGDRVLGRLAADTATGGTKAAIVERLVGTGSQVVLGIGDSPADHPLIDAARIGAWVDPRAGDETTRVRWTDRITGAAGSGSLSDLADVIPSAD
jgi:phosphoserine phosphatase